MKTASRHLPLILLLSGSLSLGGCGSSNTTSGPAPNTGNIPQLANRPSSQASALKKIRLTGTIFNSVTDAPVEKAEILIQVLEVAQPEASAAPAGGASARPPRNNNNNSATPPPPDGSSPGPTAPPLVNPDGSMSVPSVPPPTTGPGPIMPGDPNAIPTPPPGSGGGDAALPTQAMVAWAGGAFQLAQATSSSDDDASNPDSFRADTNNRGKFFVNDVPDGNYMLTVSAPGYRSLTLTEPNPTNLEIPLVPLDGGPVVDVVGMVLSPGENPVGDAMVSPSFPMGDAIGIPATTNGVGEFMLPAVPHGKHSLLAFVMNEQQQILQMGLLSDVPISDKSLKVTTPAMGAPSEASSPTPDPGQREQLENAVENILRDASPSPGDGTASPAADGAPDAEASPAGEAAPGIEVSPDPTADPSSAPLPSEGDSVIDPATTPTEAVEENEEEPSPSPRGFNLLDTVTELVTGEKPGESTPEKEVYPVISLHSVLSETILAGTLDLPEDYTIKGVDVYLALPAEKGAHPQEVYLFTQPIRMPVSSAAPEAEASAKPARSGSSSAKESAKPASDAAAETIRFRTQLPNLEKNQSYHLQFTASGPDGQLSYHHLYNQTKSSEELEVAFLDPAGEIELEGEEVNAVTPTPGMGWSSVDGAELYHVTLEAGNGAQRRVIWEAWTQNTEIRYPFSTRAYRLKPQETYTVSVEALKGLKPVVNDSKKKYAHPAYRAIWSDLARVTRAPFEVVE